MVNAARFPKQGKHSVGVARQYCGQLGKQDNCQVAVMLSLANHHASLPVAYRLYLPKEWVEDKTRRCKAGCPITSASRPSQKSRPNTCAGRVRSVLTAKEMGGPRATAKIAATRHQASADLGQGVSAQAALGCLAQDYLRERAAAPLSSRFARVRVRVAHRDYWLTETRS